jgi:hypothetical protein
MTNYQIEQKYLEANFVFELLTKYNIREVTTQKQAKNETREFEFPVPAYTKQRIEWWEKQGNPWRAVKDLPRLRLACFKSGYVRKQNGADRAYQLNPTYTQNQRYVWMRKGEFTESSELYTKEYKAKARALITSPIVRLNYMLNYYLKNYANN